MIFNVLIVIALLCCAIRSCRASLLVEFDRKETVPIRGLLALGVVIGHYLLPLSDRIPILKLLCFQTAAVPIFFFMSGFGMQRSFDVNGIKYCQGLFLHTARKLVPCMLLCSAIWILIVSVSQGGGDNGIKAGAFFEGIIRGETHFLPYSWFIFMLLIMSGIFELACRMASHKDVFITIGVVMCVFIPRFLGWGAYWTQSVLAFVVGIYWAAYELKLKRMILKYSWRFYLAMAIMFGSLMVSAHLRIVGEFATLLRQNLYGVFVISIIYMLPIPKWALLQMLGGLSLEIYLCQCIVFQFAFLLGLGSFTGLVVSLLGSIVLAAVIKCGRGLLDRLLWRKI